MRTGMPLCSDIQLFKTQLFFTYFDIHPGRFFILIGDDGYIVTSNNVSLNFSC